MGVTLIHRTAGLKADMAEDDPAIYHPSKSLEAVVKAAGRVSPVCRFLHKSFMFLEVPYAPAIHIFAGLFGEKGQRLGGGIIFSC
jgi:hypothetical protein